MSNLPPLSVLIAGAVLGLLAILILAKFFFPGWALRRKLSRVLQQLRQLDNPSKDELRRVFDSDPEMAKLWNEFQKTLHPQKSVRNGELVTHKYRATTLAETFFSEQTVVDNRLQTEFFKHFPGVFTGLGIIGTFGGLIAGLAGFGTSVDPVEAQRNLKLLLDGVREAFVFSAGAITAAMVVTVVEKRLLASLYRKVEDIAQHLDGLYQLGAGEEYLALLVTHSEESANQARILKDALVGDLKDLLKEMTERQAAAQAASTEALGRQITAGIQNSLQAPLQQIGDIVAKASGDQSSTAANLLRDVMASFSERLNDLFGGQISGIQELNQKSAQAMQEAVASLNTLIGQMEQNAQRSGDAMADRMGQAIAEMERRQADINAQTQALVVGIRDIVAQSQSETSAKLNESIASLGSQVSEMVRALESQADKSRDEHQRREQNLTDHTSKMVSEMAERMARAMEEMERRQGDINTQTQALVAGIREMVAKSTEETAAKLNNSVDALGRQVGEMVGALQTQVGDAQREHHAREESFTQRATGVIDSLGDSVVAVLKQMAEATTQMQQSVVALERTTATSIDKLGAGARNIEQGANAFAQAGERVTNTLNQAATVTAKLTEASGALTTSSTALQGVVTDYRAHREATGAMLAEVKAVVDNAKKEASMSQQTLDRIQAATSKLVEAQLKAEEYLDEVSGVLEDVHQEFADGLQRVLETANSRFHEKLSSAVSLLASAVENLEVSLSAATPARR